MNTKKDVEAWIVVAELAARQDETTPESERLSCKTLVEMALPVMRQVAEVLS